MINKHFVNFNDNFICIDQDINVNGNGNIYGQDTLSIVIYVHILFCIEKTSTIKVLIKTFTAVILTLMIEERWWLFGSLNQTHY